MNFILDGTQFEKIEIFDGKSTAGSREILQIMQALSGIRGSSCDSSSNRGVCILIERSPSYIATILACWRLGLFVVPLNTAWPYEKNKSIIDLIKPMCVVVGKVHSNDNYNCPVITIEGIAEQITLPESLETQHSTLRPTDTAYVIFTSGSTGYPKGVVISASAFRSYIDWTRRYFGEYSNCKSLLISAEFTFDITMGDIAFALAFGTRIGVVPNNSNIPSIVSMIMQNGVDVFYSVPTTHLALTNFSLQKKGADISSLRLVLSGGDTFPWDLVHRYKKLAPDAHFFNVYGPTEVTINCFAVRLDQMADTSGAQAPVPIGHAFDSIDWLLIDETGQVVNELEKLGELCVCGQQLMDGYFGDPELTRQAFVADPRISYVSRLFYRTGDLGKKSADGLVYLSGRKDNLVKIKGYRIHPDEVSRAIEHIDGVETCAVVAAGDIENACLVAFVRLQSGCTEDSAKLLEILKTAVPNYMVPAEIRYVEDFPLNQSGKIDKKKLRENLHVIVR